MITAVETVLKTGSILKVFPLGNNEVNPQPPYVILSGPDTIAGTDLYTISVHFPYGFTDELDDYVFNELEILLNQKTFTTRDGRILDLYLVGGATDIIQNSDGTISKERNFYTVGLYGGK